MMISLSLLFPLSLPMCVIAGEEVISEAGQKDKEDVRQKDGVHGAPHMTFAYYMFSTPAP